MEAQEGVDVDFFCIAHRRPKDAHDKEITGNSPREKIDKKLYAKIATEKDLKNWHYKLYPNTIGDWGCSNQWLEDYDYRDYSAVLFSHDDNFVVSKRLLIDCSSTMGEYDIISNSTGMPRGWLRGSCEMFSRDILDRMGGKFDLSQTTLQRIGKTDTPKDKETLLDWNTTVYPMMNFIQKNNVKVAYLSPYYRVSKYMIEGERGYIHYTHGINTQQEELGLKDYGYI
jgi:hypothetical protein